MKNMTLGKKIALGFGALILIAAALGTVAVFNMKSVQTSARTLATAYVPESQIAADLETAVWTAQLNIRTYGFTAANSDLEGARKAFDVVHNQQEAAKKLADEHPELVKLRAQLQDFGPALKSYEDLTTQTEASNKRILACRDELNQSAADFMANVEKLIAGQEQKLAKEINAFTEAGTLQERLHKLTLATEIRSEGYAARVAVFKSQALRDPKLLEEGLKGFEAMDKKFDELLALLKVQEDIAELNQVKAEAHTYRDAMKQVLANDTAMLALAKDRNVVAERLRSLANDTSATGMKRTVEAANSSTQELASASWIMVVGLILAILVGVGVAWLIIRSTTKVLSSVAASLEDGSNQAAAAAGQVSAASQSLAEGASEQAASLEETSSSLEEMSSMTQRNAENAQKANDLTRQARAAADTGAADMQAMNTAMQEIKTSSDEIGKIIKTIDEIAFQTNILALNAAVEAARAGEAGMGFAVVADEVRNLAQRCAQSAKETAAKIEGAIGKTAQGVQISARVTQGLQEIVTKVRQVDELVAEVATASKEQTQGISQVNTAVTEMDKVTQSNAANAEESASASEELSAQAEALKEAVGQLLCLVGGQGTIGTHHAPAGGHKPEKAAVKAAAPAKTLRRSRNNGNGHVLAAPALATASARKASELPLEEDFRNM